jgi:hypothetical protein
MLWPRGPSIARSLPCRSPYVAQPFQGALPHPTQRVPCRSLMGALYVREFLREFCGNSSTPQTHVLLI